MDWTIDDFPAVRDFCREHDIAVTFVVKPVFDEIHDITSDLDPRPLIKLRNNDLKFIFKKDCNDIGWNSVHSYTKMISENALVKLWLPAWETELIKELKNKFNIYDSAVEAHDAMRDTLLWGKFNKPLEEKFYTQNFKYDNVFVRNRFDLDEVFNKPWFQYGEYNKIVKLYDEGKDDNEMKRKESIAMPIGFGNFHMVGIKKVIFNDPATIIIWTDDVKTIVKAENEPYDPEKGMAIAIAKRALGNEGNYYDIFKKWIPKKEEKKEPEVIGKITNMIETDEGLVIEAKITDDIDSTFKDTFF